jgi:hypothetical protein
VWRWEKWVSFLPEIYIFMLQLGKRNWQNLSPLGTNRLIVAWFYFGRIS